MNFQSFTTEELAAYTNCNRQVAYGLLTFLEHAKLVVRVGTQKNSTGKGKGKTLYALSETGTTGLWEGPATPIVAPLIDFTKETTEPDLSENDNDPDRDRTP